MRYQQTSREAWDSILTGGISGALDLAILQQLEQHSVEGIICEHIEKGIGRKHQSVSGNLRHLVEKGLAEASGNYGKTSSGRRAIKWIITTYGRLALWAS